ncbi:MAG: ribokinase [Gammaproteobacteria bacterium]|nr:ribokinase [Gammaproteobacteria bacterium]
MTAPTIVVLGSVNLDIVASAPRLPVAGETVTDASLNRYPGGKGANQALAARRLGANVYLVARVGNDSVADEALSILRDDGVDLQYCETDESTSTGIALIAVAPSGENQIVVAPGANRTLLPELLHIPEGDGLICQLEVPADSVCKAAIEFPGFVCVNLAPAMQVPVEVLQNADLIVVNETEAAYYGSSLSAAGGLIATTFGARGAELRRGEQVLANTLPPEVNAIDATGAGDTFTAALTVALLEKVDPQRALQFACTAAALSTTVAGAQTSLPQRKDVDSVAI